MRIRDIVTEGGYEGPPVRLPGKHTIQGNKELEVPNQQPIRFVPPTPDVIKIVLEVMKRDFLPDFNHYLKAQGIPDIQIGHPTGSGAHYLSDPKNAVYGDIDLQIIVPTIEGKETTGERQSYWGSLVSKFIKINPNSTYITASPDGHPFIKIASLPAAYSQVIEIYVNDTLYKWVKGSTGWVQADDHKISAPNELIPHLDGELKKVKDYVQIDIMPHTEALSTWGRFRATAERGIKGLLNGNLFSVLSTIFDYNLQHSGIQYKTVDGQKVDYTKTRKGYELVTVGTDVHTFVMDIFRDQESAIKPKKVVIDPLLRQYQGVQRVENVEDLRVSYLVNAIKGLARSFEKSGMYGQGDLAPFANEQEFIQEFIRLYMEKAMYAITNKKFEKVKDPAGIARAQRDKENIAQGAEYVKTLFSSELHMPRYLDWRVKNKTA